MWRNPPESKEAACLRWYADPRNWTASFSGGPGPYSNYGRQPEVDHDRGRRARRALSQSVAFPDVLKTILEIVTLSESELASRTKIHPGRIEDFLAGLADPLPDERDALAKVLGVSSDELT